AVGAAVQCGDVGESSIVDAIMVVRPPWSTGGILCSWATFRIAWDVNYSGFFSGVSHLFFVCKDLFAGGTGFGAALMTLDGPIPDVVIQAMRSGPGEDENNYIWG